MADTCIAVLALIRSGSTPREGLYRDAIVKGVRYVRLQVDESDSQSIAVTQCAGNAGPAKAGAEHRHVPGIDIVGRGQGSHAGRGKREGRGPGPA